MTPEQSVIGWARNILGRPFAWGETDCALIALQAIECFTGRDCVADYRGRWTSEAEALAHFRTELPSQVLASMGAVEVRPSQAVIGDVITVPVGDWPEQLHVILGRFSLCASPDRGVHLLPTRLFTEWPGARLWRLA